MPSFGSASTTYGGGGATTRAVGPGFNAPDPGLLNFYKELARRQLAQKRGPATGPGIGRPRLGGSGLRPVLGGRGGAQERPASVGYNVASEGPYAMGKYNTIAGQTYLQKGDPYGDVFLGYGYEPSRIPQGAGFEPYQQSALAGRPLVSNVGYGVGQPTNAIGQPLDVRGQVVPQMPEDESWRLAAFRAQFPTGLPTQE